MKQSGHLPGIIEISNHSNGYHEHIPLPKLVGDPDKAKAVLESGKSPLILTEDPENIRGEIRTASDLLTIVKKEE